jgi:hypothetical protein
MILDTAPKYLIQHLVSKEYICPSGDSNVITRILNQSEKARAVNQVSTTLNAYSSLVCATAAEAIREWTLDRQDATYSIKNVADSKFIVAGPWTNFIKGYPITLASSTSFEWSQLWTISQETVNAGL